MSTPEASVAAPASSQGRFRKRLALLIMASILVVQGGVAGTYFLLFAESSGSVPAVKEPVPAEHGDAHADGHGDAHGTAAHDDHGGKHEEPAEDEHGDAHAADAHGEEEMEEEEGVDDGGEHGGHGGHGEAPPGRIEVDLGEFSVSAYHESRGQTMFVSFHLYALIDSKREGKFTSQFENNKHRIREKVLVLFRGAKLEDLSEPELRSLKGQTLEALNSCFSKPVLDEVMFSDFVIVPQ
ncbi:MAG: flagellar basal body-associated FliL family protein [Pirellulales bacterium]|nr:flagellar basal body-associated FliL family protein [Pirellulales bacterium]